jgi:hypothetical protein
VIAGFQQAAKFTYLSSNSILPSRYYSASLDMGIMPDYLKVSGLYIDYELKSQNPTDSSQAT